MNDLDEKNELPTKNPKFYLQVDSCGENKNKTLFAFLVDLVKRGVFNKIKVGFLMVGHTHEDIDSFFSTIAAKLKSGIVCPDFQSMVAAIQSAFDEPFDKPLVIFDYTKQYEPVIDSTIAYYQHPYQFRIKHFDENTAQLCYFTTSNGRTANSGYRCQQIFHLKWRHNLHVQPKKFSAFQAVCLHPQQSHGKRKSNEK